MIRKRGLLSTEMRTQRPGSGEGEKVILVLLTAKPKRELAKRATIVVTGLNY